MSMQVDNAKKKRIFFSSDSRKASKSITVMDAKLSSMETAGIIDWYYLCVK